MLDEGYPFRYVEIENVAKVLACGTSYMGSKHYACENPQCTHTKVICQTCNSRFCNSCGQKATERWINYQGEVLPDCEYRHLTFTMPDVLWEIFRLNRDLLNELFPIAAKGLLDFAKEKNLIIALFSALHTYGRKLNFNPHIHLSLAKIALNKHNDLKVFYFPFKTLVSRWRYGVISLLRNNAETLTLPENLSYLVGDYRRWTQFLDNQYNRYWNVHIAKKTTHKNQTKNYIGRYLKKPPIAASRLKHIFEDDVTFEYLDHYDEKRKQLSLTQREMLIRLLNQIPEKYFKMIRYFGFLSNRLRGALLPVIYEKLGQKLARIKPLRFAAMMKQMLRVDPYQCILCGKNMLFTMFSPGKSLFCLRRNIKKLALQRPF